MSFLKEKTEQSCFIIELVLSEVFIPGAVRYTCANLFYDSTSRKQSRLVNYRADNRTLCDHVNFIEDLMQSKLISSPQKVIRHKRYILINNTLYKQLLALFVGSSNMKLAVIKNKLAFFP